MEENKEREAQGEGYEANPKILISEPTLNPPSTCSQTSPEPFEDSNPALGQTEILRALEVVERDSVAIAESFTSLLSSLRLAISEVTGSSVNHMHCFTDAVGCLQESVLDAATKGNRHMNSCLSGGNQMVVARCSPFSQTPKKIPEEKRRCFRHSCAQAPPTSMKFELLLSVVASRA